MADRFPHWCSIGGTVTKKKFDKIQKKINEAGWEEVQIRHTCLDGGRLLLQASDDVGDAYNDFLTWLRKNNLAYDYVCGGHYEFNGEMHKWRPGMRKDAYCEVEANDSPFISKNSEALQKIFRSLRSKNFNRKKLIEFIEEQMLMDIPPLPPFQVTI